MTMYDLDADAKAYIRGYLHALRDNAVRVDNKLFAGSGYLLKDAALALLAKYNLTQYEKEDILRREKIL